MSLGRRRSVLPVALLAVLAAGATACGGGTKKPAARPAPTTTVAAPTTTSAGPTWPLTGEPLPAGANPAHPALVVKIDNAPKARPPAGINAADVVVEEKVEDGVTRFFTIFHSRDGGTVGPVRSARTTDIALASALNRPLFAYAGANDLFQRLIDKAPLTNIGATVNGGDYRRDNSRPRPNNLFATTSALLARAGGATNAPPPWFVYRPAGAGAGDPAAGLHLEYRGLHITTVVDYAWDAGSGTWRRSEDGQPHADAAGQQIAPRNVVVQFVNYRNTGAFDASGAPVPEADLLAGGEAWVLTDGRVVRGRWSKPDPQTPTRFVAADGKPVALTPGQTWVELPPSGAATLR